MVCRWHDAGGRTFGGRKKGDRIAAFRRGADRRGFVRGDGCAVRALRLRWNRIGAKAGARAAAIRFCAAVGASRSEEHTSELQSLMRLSYAVFCLKKKKTLHT